MISGAKFERSPQSPGRAAAATPAACRRRRTPLLLTRVILPPPADLAFVLCDQDPLCIVEQQNFDQLCSLVACFGQVDGPKRRQLIDSLCSSLTCLNAWIDKLLAAPADSHDPDSVRQHRSAFKAYIFFLGWISGLAAQESRKAAAEGSGSSATQAVGGAGRGRKKKAAASEVAGWDWGTQFPRVVKAVAQALNTDLWALFRPSGPEEPLLMKALQLVRGGGHGAAAMKGWPARRAFLIWSTGFSQPPRAHCMA